MQTVSIISLGCKVNQYEGESIASALKNGGLDVSFGLNKADSYVLITCAVTNEAERKSRGVLAKILKLNPNAKIYVCGCATQHKTDGFLGHKEVVSVLGTSNKMKIAELILNDTQNRYENTDMLACYDDYKCDVLSRTRAYLKVQDGCNNFCSYCLIPYIRGRERSRSLEGIKLEINSLLTKTKEIILTGINLSAYGKDFNNGTSLIDVAKLFKDLPVRFRFSSLEMNVITKEFLEELKTLPNFCEHFHLSMQSGCNKTLKDMNRHYTKEEFLTKIELIRKYYKNAGITTDVIVGFPTETENEFEETYNTCKLAKFSDMHIFPYSKRDGTVAAKFTNIATNVKERVNKLTELKLKIKTDFINKLKNTIEEVVIEEKHAQKNIYIGHSKNYIKCYIKSDKKLPANSVLKVKILEPFNDGAKAEIV